MRNSERKTDLFRDIAKHKERHTHTHTYTDAQKNHHERANVGIEEKNYSEKI